MENSQKVQKENHMEKVQKKLGMFKNYNIQMARTDYKKLQL